MKSTRLLWIFSCFSVSIITIILLSGISNYLIHTPNSFIRLFPPNLLNPMRVMDITFNSYYIAGADGQNFYFGNTSSPQNILVTDYRLTQNHILHLNGTNKTRLIQGYGMINVDSPIVYLMEGRIPILARCNLSTPTLFPLN